MPNPSYSDLDRQIAHDVGYQRALATFANPMTVDKLRAIAEEALSFAGGQHNQLFYSWVTGHMYGRQAVRGRPINLPYPWCPQPLTCQHIGSCPRDPNCGE